MSTHESAPGDASAPSETVPELLPRGATIGRYLVLERLGAGAMGVVYAAYDPELDRKIALKLLRPRGGREDVTGAARLVREAKAIAKLSHPNVVGIFDVGVHAGQVFMAMEYLAGGTLRKWMFAQKRPWREVLALFVEVGRGLAAAHAEGLIHRDFKPDNVLLDRNGVPKVVDFGLVRLVPGTAAGDDEPERAEVIPDALSASETDLTRTGALAGTPAYMAAEQFAGKAIDARTDQFAFCVALYEALYGERPFAGNNMLTVADAVLSGRVRPAAKTADVPGWVRRAVVQGLAPDPLNRWSSMELLAARLSQDPAAKLRRRVLMVAVLGIVVASLVGANQMVSRRRAEVERQVSLHLERGRTAAEAGRKQAGSARDLRRQSFAAFDAMSRLEGESKWRKARALLPAIDNAYDLAGRELETAFLIDHARADVREQLADLRFEHLLFAEDFQLGSKVEVLQERLSAVDDGQRRRQALAAPGTIEVKTSLPVANATLERFRPDAATGRLERERVPADRLTSSTTSLPPGSYRLQLHGPRVEQVAYPFELRRGEHLVLELALPDAGSVPVGFVYVPRGRFWFGEANEELRTGFLEATPMREVTEAAYLIARDETTFGDWIQFLRALPPEERRRRAPRGGRVATEAFVELREVNGDRWELSLRQAGHTYRAQLGEPLTYVDRDRRQTQDWRKFPVTGISAEDANAYARWLDSSGRVPHARLCTEREWERGARGADTRKFAHGDLLEPDDANFDLTYGRSAGYGPDEVGSHPLSTSPFGLRDTVGNVWEIVASSVDAGGLAVRGGSFYQFEPAQRVTNRNPIATTTRDDTVGVRICASASFRETRP